MDWRERWRVCGFPPPPSGGLAVAQWLGLMAALPPPADEPSRLHQAAEVSRLVFADSARYAADPDFIAAPGGRWATLLDPG